MLEWADNYQHESRVGGGCDAGSPRMHFQDKGVGELPLWVGRRREGGQQLLRARGNFVS